MYGVHEFKYRPSLAHSLCINEAHQLVLATENSSWVRVRTVFSIPGNDGEENWVGISNDKITWLSSLLNQLLVE